jgi:hypothetical protein
MREDHSFGTSPKWLVENSIFGPVTVNPVLQGLRFYPHCPSPVTDSHAPAVVRQKAIPASVRSLFGEQDEFTVSWFIATIIVDPLNRKSGHVSACYRPIIELRGVSEPGLMNGDAPSPVVTKVRVAGIEAATFHVAKEPLETLFMWAAPFCGDLPCGL